MRVNSLSGFFLAMLFIAFGSLDGFSQNPVSYLYENEFDLIIPINKTWSMEAGLGNRGLFAEVENGETSGYQHQHIEINHFTTYRSSNFLVLGLGLRYRFKDIFDQSETDEIRIIEQVELESANPVLPISHRLRLEQRFREQTVHRLRYELEISKSINDVLSWSAATEALFAVSAHLKPEAEQRFSIGLENTSIPNIEFELTMQYRLEDYARNLAHEFFIITGVSLAL